MYLDPSPSRTDQDVTLSFSSWSDKCPITESRVDFEGDGFFEEMELFEGEDAIAFNYSHRYSTAGSYLPRVEIIQGHSVMAVNQMIHESRPNQPPVIVESRGCNWYAPSGSFSRCDQYTHANGSTYYLFTLVNCSWQEILNAYDPDGVITRFEGTMPQCVSLDTVTGTITVDLSCANRYSEGSIPVTRWAVDDSGESSAPWTINLYFRNDWVRSCDLANKQCEQCGTNCVICYY